MNEKDDLNENQVAGRVDQAAGEVKETVGEATADKGLVREGLNEQLAGKVEENLGDRKAETSDLVDDGASRAALRDAIKNE
jgi:uncharacterized protein YjbJ (UPF0337 family)